MTASMPSWPRDDRWSVDGWEDDYPPAAVRDPFGVAAHMPPTPAARSDRLPLMAVIAAGSGGVTLALLLIALTFGVAGVVTASLIYLATAAVTVVAVMSR